MNQKARDLSIFFEEEPLERYYIIVIQFVADQEETLQAENESTSE